MLFPEAKNKLQKQKILSSPVFKQALEKMERRRVYYLNNTAQTLPFSNYRKFYFDGDRRSYEDLYFARRGRLSYLALSVLLYSRPQDIQALENAIWAVCEEFTWVLPAHTVDLGDRYNTEVIDLFSAETGFALSEIHYLLRDQLDPHILHRIEECLEERIFNMFLNHTYNWETVPMNWSAVCAGSIGAAFMYVAPERFDTVHDRILQSMHCFLSGFGDDGICLEGIDYWSYGFGFFTYFAQLLLEFTDGAEDLFQLPICHKAAFFQEYAYLRGNHTISFSDGSQSGFFLPGLTHKLHQRYGTKLLPMEYAAFSDYCHRFPAYLRNFFWVDPDSPIPVASKETEMYFPSAQWYQTTRGSLTLVAKAGHNDEPHNHNDIGSFSLINDDGQILCDFGAGEYDRNYFLPETRYTYLCNSSFGHSVPIINGNGQLPGKEYYGQVLSHGNSTLELEIANAYQIAGLQSAKRKMTLTNEIFILEDSFLFESGNAHTVTERFVTMHVPKLSGNDLVIGNYVMHTSLNVVPHISSSEIINHVGGRDTLYMIDYSLDDKTTFLLEVSKI